MKDNNQEHHLKTSPTGVFDLPGEPAIVINGVPDLPPINETTITASCNAPTAQEPHRDPGFGKWLEGREVRKLFDGEFYSGTVANFNNNSGWYRVEYEDGDSEDLDWTELESVLQPLDVTTPLKTLALKVLKRNHKHPPQKSRKVGRPRKFPANTDTAKESTMNNVF